MLGLLPSLLAGLSNGLLVCLAYAIEAKCGLGVAKIMMPAKAQGYLTPPENPLKEVFTPAARHRLTSERNPTRLLTHRLQVIGACGPYPSDAQRARKLMYLRAQKAAWEAYLCAAFACDVFKGQRGRELRGRLTSPTDEDFRSAMSECMACWFLAAKLRPPVVPSLAGRNGHELDLGVVLPEGMAGVEVKAPFRPLPEEGAYCGDDSDALQRSMDSAEKQFTNQCPNVLFLAPNLPGQERLMACRLPLIKAFYGQDYIVMHVDTRSGEPAGPVENPFSQDGKFLRPGGHKSDGSPAFTRISAVVCVEERFVKVPSGERVWHESLGRRLKLPENVFVDHDCLVLHNPHAQHPVSRIPWRGSVQFAEDGGAMRWDDGRDLYGHQIDHGDAY